MPTLEIIGIVAAGWLLMGLLVALLVVKVWRPGPKEKPYISTIYLPPYQGWIDEDPPTWQWGQAQIKGFMRQVLRDPHATKPDWWSNGSS